MPMDLVRKISPERLHLRLRTGVNSVPTPWKSAESDSRTCFLDVDARHPARNGLEGKRIWGFKRVSCIFSQQL